MGKNTHSTLWVSVKTMSFGFILSLFGFILSLVAQTTLANPPLLDLETVLKSTAKHHPKLAAAFAKQRQAASKRLAAKGEFDWQWKQQVNTRPSGYYDGWLSEQKASRQLSFANAKMHLGYRVSDGNFPVYEAEWETLPGGELNIGADVSLWRNRTINSVTLKQVSATLNEKITQIDQQITLNQLLQVASHYYLDWYFAHHQLQIAQERLSLANTREKALAEQVALGNRAQMDLNDFERERLKRRADVIKSQQTLDKAAWALALYQRNENGEPQVPNNLAPPQVLGNLSHLKRYFTEEWLHQVVSRHPAIRQLNTQSNLQKNRLRFARNQALPKLDMSVKLARDIGNGSPTLEGNESIVSLRFEMPLEKRLITGNIQTEQARLDELKWQQKNQKEQLFSHLNGLVQRLEQSHVLVDITHQQTELAKRLVGQENQRFIAGDSTQFLLNSRESDYAKAQLDSLSAEVSQRRLIIDLLAEAGEMSPTPWGGLTQITR